MWPPSRGTEIQFTRWGNFKLCHSWLNVPFCGKKQKYPSRFMTASGMWLLNKHAVNNHHLPGVKNFRIILDSSLLYSHNSSAFLHPRGFLEPSPESSQQPMNVPILQAKAPRLRVRSHPGLTRGSRLSATHFCGRRPTSPAQTVHPTAPAQTQHLTWTAATVRKVLPAAAPWV